MYILDVPNTFRAFFAKDSIRQSMSPVEITDIDIDNTKYGKAKLISPLAHNEPFGTEVWMMNKKPMARDPRYIKAGNATAKVLYDQRVPWKITSKRHN